MALIELDGCKRAGPSGSAGARGIAAWSAMPISCLRWVPGRFWPTSSDRRALTEVFRQAAQSRIIVNAHRINHGLMPDLAPTESSDFYFVDAADAEEGVRRLLTIARERIPKRFGLDAIRDIQVLCPMNGGGLGARSLNIELQTALNPPGEIRIDRFGWTFCPGEKATQVENDYDKEVYNGALGVVSRIDMEEGDLVVDFEGREVTYGFGELDRLVLAYATKIHKSQARSTRP